MKMQVKTKKTSELPISRFQRYRLVKSRKGMKPLRIWVPDTKRPEFAAAGDYGKPPSAVVIQSDLLNQNDSVLVVLITSTLADTPLFRLAVEPTPENGLKLPSQIMVDKIIAYPREKCGVVIGSLDQATLIALNHMLAVVVGIAD